LKNQLPKEILSVAESGIYNEEDFRYLKNEGFDGFLMGEYFMKHEDPGKNWLNLFRIQEFKNQV
jgi:indole-3-glycerol phosphate synthase